MNKFEAQSRIFESLDKGKEKHVYSHSKNGREGRTVVKKILNNDTTNRLFTVIEKQSLKNTYNRLKAQYGDFVVPQKILKQNGGYLLVQKKIDTAPVSDIFHYSAEQIPNELSLQVEYLVGLLKKGYESYERKGETVDNNVPLDLFGENNLVVTTEGNIAYLDLGMPLSEKFEDWEPEYRMIYKGLILYLEYLSGKQPDLIVREDSFYQDFFDHFNTEENRHKKPWTHWKYPVLFLNKILSA